MSHAQGDGIVGFVGGAAFTLVMNIANVFHGPILAEVLHNVVMGVIGGTAGWVAKQAIERYFQKRKNNNKQ
ncbi:MAG TPA: hypothetical protein PL070_08785 [Flavobacteriales bacterium]|nr:hypothetical protein [Flavobacteriales bacterium]